MRGRVYASCFQTMQSQCNILIQAAAAQAAAVRHVACLAKKNEKKNEKLLQL